MFAISKVVNFIYKWMIYKRLYSATIVAIWQAAVPLETVCVYVRSIDINMICELI